MITLTNWTFDVPDSEVNVGFEGENLVYTLRIMADTGPDWQYYVDISFSNDAKATLPLRYNNGVLEVEMTRAYLSVDGWARAQIRGMDGDRVKKSNIARLYISDSINASEELPALPPSEFQFQEKIIQYMVERAEKAAAHMPYPDVVTGTWWLWDMQACKYVDSGVPCTADSGSVAPIDHSQLTGRDAPDAHPISAVTGLKGSLDSKLTSSGYISNEEIQSILDS